MAKTPNLGLHQWQPGDSFLREDFNGDFSKIDGAMGAVTAAMPYEKLFDVTITAGTSLISINLSKVDWSKYYELVGYAELSCSSNIPCSVRINGLNTLYGGYSDYAPFNSTDGMMWATLGPVPITISFHIPCKSKNFNIYGYVIEQNGTMRTMSGTRRGDYAVPMASVATLDFVASTQPMSPGSKVTIYGVRKL